MCGILSKPNLTYYMLSEEHVTKDHLVPSKQNKLRIHLETYYRAFNDQSR